VMQRLSPSDMSAVGGPQQSPSPSLKRTDGGASPSPEQVT
jgi:hypothetical protein